MRECLTTADGIPDQSPPSALVFADGCTLPSMLSIVKSPRLPAMVATRARVVVVEEEREKSAAFLTHSVDAAEPTPAAMQRGGYRVRGMRGVGCAGWAAGYTTLRVDASRVASRLCGGRSGQDRRGQFTTSSRDRMGDEGGATAVGSRRGVPGRAALKDALRAAMEARGAAATTEEVRALRLTTRGVGPTTRVDAVSNISDPGRVSRRWTHDAPSWPQQVHQSVLRRAVDAVQRCGVGCERTMVVGASQDGVFQGGAVGPYCCWASHH